MNIHQCILNDVHVQALFIFKTQFVSVSIMQAHACVCMCVRLSLLVNEEEMREEDERRMRKRWGEEGGFSGVFPALICFDSSSLGSGTEQAFMLYRRERNTKYSYCLSNMA